MLRRFCLHCVKYNGFQSFFTCLDAMRVQLYAKIQLLIHIISQFSVDIIIYENILEWINEASLLDTVLQTSGSTLDFVETIMSSLEGLYSRNPFVSKENGTQYWIIIAEKARASFANKIRLTSVLQTLVCIDKGFSFIVITYHGKTYWPYCKQGRVSCFQCVFLDHFSLKPLSLVHLELEWMGYLQSKGIIISRIQLSATVTEFWKFWIGSSYCKELIGVGFLIHRKKHENPPPPRPIKLCCLILVNANKYWATVTSLTSIHLVREIMARQWKPSSKFIWRKKKIIQSFFRLFFWEN